MAKPPVRLLLPRLLRSQAQHSIPHPRAIHTIHPLTTKESKTAPNPPQPAQATPTKHSKSTKPPKPHRLPPRPKIPENDLTESFIHGSGPGGQKINKTASAVQLTHLPTGTVLKCQATRSRIQNRKIARELLAEKLDVMQNGEGARSSIKAQIGVVKKRSKEKKSRRKYRVLEVGVGEEGDEREVVEEVEEGEEVAGGSEEEAVDELLGLETAADREQGEGESVAKMPSGTKDDVGRLFEEAKQRMGKTRKSNDAIK